MIHISEIIENILVEWAYRVHDGMPNPKNTNHILELRSSMEELDIPNDIIFQVIQNLINEDGDDEEKEKKRKLAKSKGLENISFNNYKDSSGKIWNWNADQQDFIPSDSSPSKDGNADTDAAGGSDKSPSDASSEKPNDGKSITMNIDKDGGMGNSTDSGDESDQDVSIEPTGDELRKQDHQTTDSQLNLSVAEAKAQAEKKGLKGVGAGTAESRAGEAAVHYAVRELVAGGNIDDIKKTLIELARDSDKVLNEKWAKAAVNTAQWINDVYGDDIKEVVWDTPEGRKLINVEGHGTSADMFIKTKDGKNIGISLKQTTAVFLLNGGYKKQQELLLESLSDTLTAGELEDFKTNTSITTYKTGFNSQLTTIRNTFSSDEKLKNTIKERVEIYKNLSDDEFKKIFDSTKYRKHLENLDKIISKLPHVKGEEMKFIAKLVKDPEVRKSFPELYDNLRGEEIKLTQSILTASNSNPNVAKGIKKLCMDGMHIEDILFGKSDKLDEFITLYGNNPAVELDKGVLLQIFGLQDEYEQYMSIEDESEKEAFREELLEKMYDKISIDIKDGARSGEVKITHENGEFNLFGIKARTKPLGSSPGLEMNQTTFMGNVIKEGTTDVSKWKQSTKKRFVSARIKEISEELLDSNSEQKKALMEEIEELKAIL